MSRGCVAAYKQTHARILLLSDESQPEGALKDGEIARFLKVGTTTVERVRRRCVEEGLESALGRKEQVNRRQKKPDGQGEAHLIALACSPAPEGRYSWTLQLLADQLVEREIVASISTETVRRTLKKRTQAPVLQRGRLWLKECWCIPPRPMLSSCARWRMCWRSITVNSRTTRS